jgi:hypothetical protein
MEEVVGDTNSTLFGEGDVGDAVYFLVEGELRVENRASSSCPGGGANASANFRSLTMHLEVPTRSQSERFIFCDGREMILRNH